MKHFALTGAAGYVAPRHMQAIKDVGGKLDVALDLSDSVGVLDRYDRSTSFFTEPERFERYLNINPVDWLSVCSPNHLHDSHARLGMHTGANVICEKPLVLSPWNLDALAETERKTGRRVYTVLQLRHLPKLTSLLFLDSAKRHHVQLRYITPRGHWYGESWKGEEEKSGGIITNIGIHMLDVLLWLFGKCDSATIELRTSTRAKGTLQLARADVEWFLSIDNYDSANGEPHRDIVINGEKREFSDGFGSLHSKVYEETLAGRGHGIEDARPSVELAYKLRNMKVG